MVISLKSYAVTRVSDFEDSKFFQAVLETQSKDQYVSEFFGSVGLFTSAFRVWKISNTGSSSIEIKKIIIRGAMYSAQTDCPETLRPKEVCKLGVRFSPTVEGYFTGQLDFIFSEGGNIYFDFSGSGVR